MSKKVIQLEHFEGVFVVGMLVQSRDETYVIVYQRGNTIVLKPATWWRRLYWRVRGLVH